MKKTRHSESQIFKALKNEERPHDALGDLTPFEY